MENQNDKQDHVHYPNLCFHCLIPLVTPIARKRVYCVFPGACSASSSSRCDHVLDFRIDR